MAAPSGRGLGRGLDALLGGLRKEMDTTGAEIRVLPVDAIRPNPNQPRQGFAEHGLSELAESIKSQGVLQPILVRPLPGSEGAWEVVAGERRLRAARLAGLSDLPAIVRELSDQESLAVALIENLQREDLNPIDEARGLQQLLSQFGLSQEDLARQIGKSRPAVANALRLLNLPQAVQSDIREERLTPGHGRAIMSVTDETAAAELHARIKANNLSVRQAEAEALYWKQHGELPKDMTEPHPDPESGRRRSRATALEEVLAELQRRLEESLGIAVRIAGRPEKGTLTFRYVSREQLDGLAVRLGVAEM